MSEPRTGKLPDSLIVAGLTHVIIGVGFLRLSQPWIQRLTYNIYVGLIPAVLIILPIVWEAAYLARLFPGLGVTRIFQKTLGKFLGSVLALLLIIRVTGTMALTMQESHLMVVTYFLRRTPITLVTFIFLAIAVYLALSGIKSTVRLAGFMFLPALAVLFGLHLLGLGNVHSLNIRPVFGGAPKSWILAGFDLVYVFLPIYTLLFYLPYARGPGSVKRIGLAALGLSFPLFVLALLGTVGAFGPTVARMLPWPTVEFFHVIDLPIVLVEQAGLFFIITWYGFFLLAVAQVLFFLGRELNVLIPRIERRWFSLAIGLVILTFNFWRINLIDLSKGLRYLEWITNLSVFVPLPVIWLAAWWRFGRSKSNGRQNP